MTAPILQDSRTTTTITLEQYPGSEVVLFDSVLVADALGMSSLIKDKSPEELLKALPRLIKSWNFVDANQQPMPITAESLGLLSVDALTVMATVLTEKIQAAVEAKKKATKA